MRKDILTFDLEVENHVKNKRLASPWDKRNYVVASGWSINGGKPEGKYYDKWHRDWVLPNLDTVKLIVGFNIKFDLLWQWVHGQLRDFLKDGGQIYCGQYAEYLLGGMTQDVQMISMNSVCDQYGGGLKNDAVKEMWEAGYLTSEIPKDLLMDYLLGDGKQIVGDVENTWRIFRGQLTRMNRDHKPEFKKMFKNRMDGYLATCEMENNGLAIDTKIGETERERLAEAIETGTKELESYIPELPEELTFNWNSNVHKSALIFGGSIGYKRWVQHKDEEGNLLYAKKKEDWPLFEVRTDENKYLIPWNPEEAKAINGVYYVATALVKQKFGLSNVSPDVTGKTGVHYLRQQQFASGKRAGQGKFKKVDLPDKNKPKGAQQDFYVTLPGYTRPKHVWAGSLEDAQGKPVYATNADVMDELAERNIPFLNKLLEVTAMEKDLGTYYWKEDKNGKRKGMLTLVDENNIVHHNLNHTNTVTGRMSSSNPNLQNIPRSGTSAVKKMFVTRFGEKGRVVEIDYSQLEVVIQGVLSNDENLRRDLNKKIDFHCKRLAAKSNISYEEAVRLAKTEKVEEWVEARTGVKEFSFQRAYGAGATTIAASTGMSVEEVKKLIELEEKMYPGVARFDQSLEKHITSTAYDSGNKLFVGGLPVRQKEAYWDAPTGTRYKWRQGIAPEFLQKKGIFAAFSPTERKNYPMQGFGGEVVQTMLGKVFRFFAENNWFNGEVLMTNTVHDCMLLDGIDPLVVEVAKECKKIMESVPEVFNAQFPKLQIDVPFPCEVEVGKDLYTMNEVH